MSDQEAVSGLMKRGPSFVREWWLKESTADADHVVAKLLTYGSLDLHAQGMLELMGWTGHGLGTESVIAFYALGKLNRIITALARGKPASPDSWDDMRRYAMMARYVQQFGRWP